MQFKIHRLNQIGYRESTEKIITLYSILMTETSLQLNWASMEWIFNGCLHTKWEYILEWEPRNYQHKVVYLLPGKESVTRTNRNVFKHHNIEEPIRDMI